MKKLILLTSLMGVLFILNACGPAYVSVRPSHMDVARPIRPSSSHIWIDGNWVYSRREHSYSRINGYWSKPNRGRTYRPGQWKTSRKGDHWVQGRWR